MSAHIEHPSAEPTENTKYGELVLLGWEYNWTLAYINQLIELILVTDYQAWKTLEHGNLVPGKSWMFEGNIGIFFFSPFSPQTT